MTEAPQALLPTDPSRLGGATPSGRRPVSGPRGGELARCPRVVVESPSSGADGDFCSQGLSCLVQKVREREAASAGCEDEKGCSVRNP